MTLHSEASDGAILNYLAGTTDAASSGALRRIAALVAAMQGAGSPEGVLTAAVGSLYTDTTAGTLYIKASGTGNTGWTAMTSGDLSLKANLAGPTFTGTVVLPSTTSVGNVSSTELGYLDGVTSAIQTQIGTKVDTPTSWTSYTPTWTATGGTPGVGSGAGSLTGEYIKQGTLCHVRIYCNLGTSPTGLSGTTLWKFSLPFATDGVLTGTAMLYDADGGLLMGFSQRADSVTTVYVMTDASAYVGATVPITWASDDYLAITATYKVAA